MTSSMSGARDIMKTAAQDGFNPFAPFLGPVQHAIGLALVPLRMVLRVFSWEDRSLTSWLCFALGLSSLAALLLPLVASWATILLVAYRAVGLVLLGPQNRHFASLVDAWMKTQADVASESRKNLLEAAATKGAASARSWRQSPPAGARLPVLTNWPVPLWPTVRGSCELEVARPASAHPIPPSAAVLASGSFFARKVPGCGDYLALATTLPGELRGYEREVNDLARRNASWSYIWIDRGLTFLRWYFAEPLTDRL